MLWHGCWMHQGLDCHSGWQWLICFLQKGVLKVGDSQLTWISSEPYWRHWIVHMNICNPHQCSIMLFWSKQTKQRSKRLSSGWDFLDSSPRMPWMEILWQLNISVSDSRCRMFWPFHVLIGVQLVWKPWTGHWIFMHCMGEEQHAQIGTVVLECFLFAWQNNFGLCTNLQVI